MQNAFMRTPGERLKWARERAGFEYASDAAEAMGVPEPTYLAHENGSRGLKARAEQYARRLHVDYEWLMTGRGQPKAGQTTTRAVGFVGAGAQVEPVDDHAPGGGLDEVELPPGVPLDAVLVIVRGDSMYPRYFDGEYLFYVRDQHSPEELIGRECVVKLQDGRTFVKVLRPGSSQTLFNLESWNTNTPTMVDQAVDWAAPVTARVNRQRVA